MADRRHFLLETLAKMDAFSEILAGVRLNGALYFHAEFSAPWGFSAPASDAMAQRLSTGPGHLVIYHFLLDGTAKVRIPDGTEVALDAGDVVIFPHGHAHEITSVRDAIPPYPNYGISIKVKNRDLSPLHAGGGGEKSRFVCGYMNCDPVLSRPILSGLPAVFKVSVRGDASGEWLENSLLRLVAEASSGSPGSDAMLAKLSEALFVDTLRRYVAALPEQQMGWLAGARDPIVGKTLRLMHSRIAQPWTVADLAGEVGISRSALVERFARYLDEPPMTYLTRLRLQLAARSLTGTTKGVAEIAADVGYESEAAFNRAFKREFGTPPGRYRIEQRRPAATGMPAG